MRFFYFILACGLALSLFSEPCLAMAPEPGTDVVAELYPQYNGVVVGKIEVLGLVRSRAWIVRWMLGAREGEPFDAQSWQSGIEHLYKTESLYEIHTSFEKRNTTGREEILIRLSLRDKWTLFPYLDFQGGGGSVSFSAGIFDTNVLGTFTNFYVGGGYLDKEYSYEAGLSQKWFLQTSYSLAFEFAKRVAPVTMQNAEGAIQQNFTWSRARQQVTVGKQNGERVYWDVKLETFHDSLRSPTVRTSSFIFPEMQQFRISPSIRFWKVSHSDYLEQGHELTLGVSYANPLNVDRDYHGISASWKQVFYLPDTKNIAYYVSAGHLTDAPLAYQYHLGGFDSVRGFSMNRSFGLDTAHANLEYRSTLLVYRIPFWDLDRMVLQSCFFTDGGVNWRSAAINTVTGQLNQDATRALYSVGAGVRAIFLHFANATARIDVAKAVIPQEGFNVAFGVGQFF